MKTNSTPALIMLLAGSVACIAGIRAHMDVADFMKMLLIVLIVFYFLGCIVKIILDKYFAEKKDEETTDGEVPQEEGEEDEDASETADEETASGEDEK